MIRKLIVFLVAVFTASTVLAFDLEFRKQLPSISERMVNQRLDRVSITGIRPRAITEQAAFFFSEGKDGLETTFALNPYRLFQRNSNTFYGYRGIPWWLRNTQLAVTIPNKEHWGDFTIELDWGLYRKAHKWDEYWDSYFPQTEFPKTEGQVSEEWLQKEMWEQFIASEQVDSLLLIEGNDGFSFSFTTERQKGAWDRFSFTFIGSHHLGDWLATVNGSGQRMSDNLGAEFAGQLSRDIDISLWTPGGLAVSITGSVAYLKRWDWLTTASVGIPVWEKMRFILSFALNNEQGRVLGGFSYQLLPNS